MTKIGLPEAGYKWIWFVHLLKYDGGYHICSVPTHMTPIIFTSDLFSSTHLYICVSIMRVTHRIVYSPRGYNSTGSFPSCILYTLHQTNYMFVYYIFVFYFAFRRKWPDWHDISVVGLELKYCHLYKGDKVF